MTYIPATGIYEVSQNFMDALVADPEPLWGCDDATVLLTANGFEVDDANSGELLHELGLRDGDIIVSLNSIALDDFADVGGAFSTLWSNGVTSYTLEIERNSNSLELDYSVTSSP